MRTPFRMSFIKRDKDWDRGRERRKEREREKDRFRDKERLKIPGAMIQP